jgi:hypothetical protein
MILARINQHLDAWIVQKKFNITGTLTAWAEEAA